MLEKKYESAFITINYDKEKEYLETIWKEVDYMKDEQVMDELKVVMELNQQYTPKYSFTDESKKQFGYSPELQNKMTQYLKETHNAEIQTKSAVILSNDLMAQLSLEQLDDENQKQANFEGLNFFKSREEALAWLFD